MAEKDDKARITALEKEVAALKKQVVEIRRAFDTLVRKLSGPRNLSR